MRQRRFLVQAGQIDHDESGSEIVNISHTADFDTLNEATDLFIKLQDAEGVQFVEIYSLIDEVQVVK